MIGPATEANAAREHGKKVSAYARAANDWYVEPPWIVEKLLEVETFEGQCWEPAAGAGNIPRVLHQRGIHCMATDLVQRGYPFAKQLDFLAVTNTQVASNIISNPPFCVIEDWIRVALAKTTRKVALLQRLALLEGIERGKLFDETPPSRVWISRRRVSMPPGEANIKASGSKTAYAWFVWDHEVLRRRGDAPARFEGGWI